jgi:type IV pilus assembly protein PilB
MQGLPPTQTTVRIGEYLVQQGYIQDSQLKQALLEAKASQQPIGSVLVRLGIITAKQLGQSLADIHHVQYLDAEHIQLNPAVMSLLPEAFIRQNCVVPLAVDDASKRLAIVMARPDSFVLLDHIAALTGYRPVPKLSTHAELTELIDQFYSKNQLARQDAMVAQLEENLQSSDHLFGLGSAEAIEDEVNGSDAPTVQLVNSLLLEAIQQGASDIHIEPQKERLFVRFRIDGLMKEVRQLPKSFSGPVVSRIKVASGMDIAEKRRPQDGRMKINAGSQQIDMRVNSLAVQFGEKIVIRLLKPNATTGGLDKLGMDQEDVDKLERLIHQPNGVVLVTGPTGSGKTTTLYACLRALNSVDRNINTIEDPIEYPIAGLNQTQVSTKSGLTFALCLRAILRQDPDVILVGEIRDEETLEAAIHAALTGHLVFSTIHTNSASKTITRLFEMGAKPYLVSSAVIGIVAQRLIRRLCLHCKEPDTITDTQKKQLNIKPTDTVNLCRPVGCEHCEKSGYSGRVGLYEIMPLSRELQTMIESQAPINLIEDIAVKEGMQTLAESGRRKILAGLTTIEEVTRVIGVDQW